MLRMAYDLAIGELLLHGPEKLTQLSCDLEKGECCCCGCVF